MDVDYTKLQNDIDEYVSTKVKLKEKLKEKERKEIFYQDCCICYDECENTFKVKTDCNHYMCMPCLYQLKKQECPMCRKEFPEDIQKILPIKKTLDNGNYGQLQSSFVWSGTPMSTSYSLR